MEKTQKTAGNPVLPPPSAKKPSGKSNSGPGKVFNKILAFFSNKWTKFGFSFLSVGYIWFLIWVARLTFGYHFVFEEDKAAAVFLLYTFINVMFAIVMIYTRRNTVTKLAALFMHPFIIVMLIYGFGNWYLMIPPFIAATVIFFASGVDESLKVILGTVYMILFVLAFLAYVTLESLTISIPYKMPLHLRTEIQADASGLRESPNFRVVAYVDPETKEKRTAAFYIEPIDSDKQLWNLTCEKISHERIGPNVLYERIINPEHEFELKWISSNVLSLDGRHFEIDKNGKMVVVDGDEVSPAVTTTAATSEVDTSEISDFTEDELGE
ncbi:MAG: hypothetical protein FWG83_04990 [Oscillospiraceae bacterium]|nr:hypothetical protein [Oscillospiraceae bacterium]